MSKDTAKVTQEDLDAAHALTASYRVSIAAAIGHIVRMGLGEYLKHPSIMADVAAGTLAPANLVEAVLQEVENGAFEGDED